jgi:Raf kinase inhibitor-like YbhB/YbcL family protein
MQNLIVNSPDFDPHGRLPDRFTCEGDNVNPTLQISRLPKGTKSLAVMVDDVDAIRPEGPFVHWLIWNLDPRFTTLGENTVPPGAVEGTNSAGKTGWTGPCPPGPQPHHYRFMVYALNYTLDLPAGSDRVGFEEAIKDKILGKGQIIGEYHRIIIG